MTSRKSHTPFRLVPKSTTLDAGLDLSGGSGGFNPLSTYSWPPHRSLENQIRGVVNEPPRARCWRFVTPDWHMRNTEWWKWHCGILKQPIWTYNYFEPSASCGMWNDTYIIQHTQTMLIGLYEISAEQIARHPTEQVCFQTATNVIEELGCKIHWDLLFDHVTLSPFFFATFASNEWGVKWLPRHLL